MFGQSEHETVSLSELQAIIKQNIGQIRLWIKAEVESHNERGGHHYLNLIQKSPDGEMLAKASARIWRSNAHILSEFKQATGKDVTMGMSITVLASVDYHPLYGLTLIISEIDSSCEIGERELEKMRTMKRLQEEELLDCQKELALPFLPFRLAVISSESAAGYGDFCRHLKGNSYGYTFGHKLFPALMQGESAAASICSAIKNVEETGGFDFIIILRGGGADYDLFCYDDYELCKAIALSHVPVLTAIGHEKDFHLADLVANEHFKTPTAVANFLIDWLSGIEEETERCFDNIRFALGAAIGRRENELALLESSIFSANPLNILKQGYVLACDEMGKVVKSASQAHAGDKFTLRFADGKWESRIEKIAK